MIVVFILAAGYSGWRALRAAQASLAGLPRRNEDMVFY